MKREDIYAQLLIIEVAIEALYEEIQSTSDRETQLHFADEIHALKLIAANWQSELDLKAPWED